jgi:two-component system, cell cycle sensor histidine kinase and response regulator CckA
MEAGRRARLSTEQALLDSEHRLQQVLDATSALVFAKDAAGRYIFVNREFVRLCRRTAADVLGRTDEEIFPPALATRFRHNDLRVLQERRGIEFEELADFGDGPRTYIASKFPLFDASGQAYAVCGMATDITERKRLEEALSSAALAVSQSEEETLYRQLVRFLTAILGVDGAFIATVDAHRASCLDIRAFFLDGQIRENFSYSQAGTPCETVVGQEFRLYASKLDERFPADVDFSRLGFRSYAGYPLFDAQGRALGLIAVVSRGELEQGAFIESVMRIFAVRANAELEREASRRALESSEASYREIFEAGDDAILVLDWDNAAIVDANPRACETYGHSRAELIALGVAGLGTEDAPPYSRVDALRWLAHARRDGSARFEWRRRGPEGLNHWDEVRLKVAVIGGRRRILAITREITERKNAEEVRERLEASLRQAQKMQAIGQLTGGIAHDFNNLLTTILGYVVLAAERETAQADPRLASYLQHARRSCERARDLVQQMLMFSRGHRGEPCDVELRDLVADALPTLRSSLPGGIELDAELAADQTCVRVDPLQAEQVITNLCLNARDAMAGQGRLGISVRSTEVTDAVCAGCRETVAGDFVELTIRDTGPGIGSAVAERIFEPFFSTKQVGRGTGMGLAIVHGIVHEHGGHVLLETRPGEGSRFRVLWPRGPSQSSGGARPPRVRAGSALARPELSGRVLIVDDEEAVGEFMRELLDTWGLRATFVNRAEAALQRVRETPDDYDVVLTDQAMPRMTGLELARALADVRADLPVLLYTGNDDGIGASGVRGAPRAVLRKPIDPARLAAALQECLVSTQA